MSGSYGSMDAVFIGRTHFCITDLRIWYFFGQETYIHFVSQETKIIRQLFIFNFFIKKGIKVGFYYKNGVNVCSLVFCSLIKTRSINIPPFFEFLKILDSVKDVCIFTNNIQTGIPTCSKIHKYSNFPDIGTFIVLLRNFSDNHKI